MSVQFVLVRIDDRLMHGQVAVGWTKAVRPDHIIIANDAVSHDTVQRMLIEMASPNQYGLTICEINQVARICEDKRMANQRVLLLFASPADVVQAVEQGLNIQKVNVGGLRYSAGKKQIMKAVAIDQADSEQFKILINRGVEVQIQMVPTDEPVAMKHYLT